jgi:hypothetical protein
MTEINPNTCFSRKSAKSSEQCTNKKKANSDYCGKHTNCTNPYKPTISLSIPPKPLEVPERDSTSVDATLPPSKIIEEVPKKLVYQNDTDFFTLESITLIPKEFVYEYKEANKYYVFDIRTLNDYFNSCNELEGLQNPFTHVDIPKEKVNEIKSKYKSLAKKGFALDQYKEDIKFEPHKQLEWRCLDIFQKIDHLGHYVDYKWFWDLSLYDLKRMYLGLEDLWNYRLPLTKHQKQRILPNYIPFQVYTVQVFNALLDQTHARTILLDEIDKFITMGKTEGKTGNDNKYIGSILVLTSLVEVSKIAADVLPHLVPIL